MKGIILAAGNGTRMVPATFPISKILLPIYDRPMIYYPLSTLMMAGIRDILVITNERDAENFRRTLGDGSQFGLNIEYEIQYVQRGISDAFIIAKDWIGGERVSLVLGDNLLFGTDIESLMTEAASSDAGAVIFGYPVPDPERFGVVAFDKDMMVTSLEEKPKEPKSNYAAVGVYFYDSEVCEIAKSLKPSSRGELEITDLNLEYLKKGKLSVKLFSDGTKWMDAGTFDSLLEASSLISKEEKRLGKKILCPEIVAYRKGFVSKEKLCDWISSNVKNEYFESIKRELGL